MTGHTGTRTSTRNPKYDWRKSTVLMTVVSPQEALRSKHTASVEEEERKVSNMDYDAGVINLVRYCHER
jgi:hypothetical protein